jgi:orotate phosphoribosyltransferase
VIEILTDGGARVLAAGSIIDRSGGAVELGVPRVALKTLEVLSYSPEDCPLCRAGSPVVKPGSRPVHAAN